MDGDNVFNIRGIFSKNLKRLRNAANISQLALAGRANLTHNFINDIENGKKWVSDDTIGKLATALKAEPYQFFLAETKWNEKSAEILATYLSDIENTFLNITAEYRHRYIPDSSNSEEADDDQL